MTFMQYLKIKKGVDTEGKDLMDLMEEYEEYYEEYMQHLRGIKDGCSTK